jgi:hypothetical protein
MAASEGIRRGHNRRRNRGLYCLYQLLGDSNYKNKNIKLFSQRSSRRPHGDGP